MRKSTIARISRRDFVKISGGAAVNAITGPVFAFSERLAASQRTLKIIQWNHFVPQYDTWFNNFTKDWGEKHDTNVIVDNVDPGGLLSRAASEAQAAKGHDLFMFLSSPARFEQQVIPLNDIYEDAIRKHGKLADGIYKSSYNPATKHFFSFVSSYAPTPGIRIKALWDEVGYSQGIRDYEELFDGATKIKEKSGIPCGIELSRGANAPLLTLLSAFGGSIQDETGNPAINSKGTIEAVKYMASLYRRAEEPKVFTWTPLSTEKQNALREGTISYAMGPPAVVREDDDDDPTVPPKPKCPKPPCTTKSKAISAPLKAIVEGFAIPTVLSSYVIWKFSENQEGAQRFLLDLVAKSQDAFQASRFFNFPSFPGAIPNLKDLLGKSSKTIPGKYNVLADAHRWTTNFGHPGFNSAKTDMVFYAQTIPTMFVKVANGQMTAEDAVKEAQQEVERIFSRFKEPLA